MFGVRRARMFPMFALAMGATGRCIPPIAKRLSSQGFIAYLPNVPTGPGGAPTLRERRESHESHMDTPGGSGAPSVIPA